MKLYVITHFEKIVGIVTTQESADRIVSILDKVTGYSDSSNWEEVTVGEEFLDPWFMYKRQEEEFKKLVGGV